jgi:alanine dehydrogenase
LQLANLGWKEACKQNKELMYGLNMIGGEIVYDAVAEAFGFSSTSVDTFLN